MPPAGRRGRLSAGDARGARCLPACSLRGGTPTPDPVRSESPDPLRPAGVRGVRGRPAGVRADRPRSMVQPRLWPQCCAESSGHFRLSGRSWERRQPVSEAGISNTTVESSSGASAFARRRRLARRRLAAPAGALAAAVVPLATVASSGARPSDHGTAGSHGGPPLAAGLAAGSARGARRSLRRPRTGMRSLRRPRTGMRRRAPSRMRSLPRSPRALPRALPRSGAGAGTGSAT